jgi:hypothetical protein
VARTYRVDKEMITPQHAQATAALGELND